jgi:hypothetical protein
MLIDAFAWFGALNLLIAGTLYIYIQIKKHNDED